jgi:hypothetical protein
MRPGAASTHSGTAIGLPHWAQGFSRGKEKKSFLAMAHLPFHFLLCLKTNWTGWLSDADAPSWRILREQLVI